MSKTDKYQILGNFPPKTTLENKLDEILCETDLKTFPLSSICYEQLRDAWTEQFREEAVTYFAEKVMRGLRNGVFPNKQMISNVINGVWENDKADLCSLIRERVCFLRNVKNR